MTVGGLVYFVEVYKHARMYYDWYMPTESVRKRVAMCATGRPVHDTVLLVDLGKSQEHSVVFSSWILAPAIRM